MISIILTESLRQCLLNAVMRGSLIHVALTAATRPTGSGFTGEQVLVQCERDVAAALLVVATRCCPKAVRDIEVAIVEARGRSSPA